MEVTTTNKMAPLTADKMAAITLDPPPPLTLPIPQQCQGLEPSLLLMVGTVHNNIRKRVAMTFA